MSQLVDAGVKVGMLALATLLSIPIGSRTVEQQPRSTVEDVGASLEPIRAEQKVPALAVVVLRGDRIIAVGATGVRRNGSEERVTINDTFHLGSDTKAMTATLIAKLVEEGRLSWSTTVGEVFGEAVPQMNPAWRAVTIEQLLRHRAGAPRDLDPDTNQRLAQVFLERSVTPVERRMTVVSAVITRAPAFPGTQYMYSNIGYVIAGAMAEKRMDRAFDELMQEKVFLPLGIKSGGFGAPGSATQVDQPWGHLLDGSPVPPGPRADSPPFMDPAGRAHMTLGDWAKFVSVHLLGDSQNHDRKAILLKAETFDTLHLPIEDYAMGWGVVPHPVPPGRKFFDKSGKLYEGTILFHSGTNNRWESDVWLFPELNLAILAATNQAGDAGPLATGKAGAMLFEKFK